MEDILDDNTRLQLQKMVNASNATDQTELIRKLKAQFKIVADIHTLQQLKVAHKGDLDKVHQRQ